MVPIREYPEYQNIKTVASGYLNRDRINALKALLTSEEVYIIKDDVREPVTVTASDKIPDVINEPVNINITVKSYSNDHGYIPDLFSSDYSDPRIHSEMYNKKFN